MIKKWITNGVGYKISSLIESITEVHSTNSSCITICNQDTPVRPSHRLNLGYANEATRQNQVPYQIISFERSNKDDTRDRTCCNKARVYYRNSTGVKK